MRQDTASELEAKQEQLIFALLQKDTKEEAAAAAGVHRSTMYRWLADPVFIAAYQAARRAVFDESLAILEKGAVKAARRLMRELDDADEESSRISAAKAVLDRAFKAMESVEVERELAMLRATIAKLKASALEKNPPAPPAPPTNQGLSMDDGEQAEADRLRVAWMGEIGHTPADIESSLRYNRPRSATEELHLLELVRNLLEAEKTYTQNAGQ